MTREALTLCLSFLFIACCLTAIHFSSTHAYDKNYRGRRLVLSLIGLTTAATTVQMQGDYVKTRNILSWTICNEKGRYLMGRKTLSTGEILETWTHLADPAMRFGDEQSAKDFCLPGQTIAKWVSREVL